jgi:hypothetical protein
MLEAWIEDSRQQLRVVCNHGAVLCKVDYQGWSKFRPKKYGNAAHNARAAERRRLGTVCRGSILDAKLHSQLLEAFGPSLSSNSEIV